MTITIYSKTNCVYCTKAKALIKGLGLEYEEKTLEETDLDKINKLIISTVETKSGAKIRS